MQALPQTLNMRQQRGQRVKHNQQAENRVAQPKRLLHLLNLSLWLKELRAEAQGEASQQLLSTCHIAKTPQPNPNHRLDT